MNGTAASTAGSCMAFARAAGQSAKSPCSPVIVACAVTLRIRLRNSRSKPFMTDNTTMSTATPSMRPSTDMIATNEMNPCRRAPLR
jgi:hypothetical protein